MFDPLKLLETFGFVVIPYVGFITIDRWVLPNDERAVAVTEILAAIWIVYAVSVIFLLWVA